jgi:hypothetical protein
VLGWVVAAWIFAQGGAPIVTPPQPSEIHVTNTTVLNVPPMDPQAVTDASVMADQAFIVNVAQPIPVEWVNSLCSLPDIWRTTPPNLTYDQGSVRDLAQKIEAAALAFVALAILAQGLGHALGQDLQLGRVALAIVLCIGNLTWWQIGIGLNNAITAAIGAPDLCGSLIRPHIALQNPAPASAADQAAAALGGPVVVIVYAFVSALLLISLMFRLGLLDVLIAVGSLALMCFASEQSEHIGQWYVRLSVGTIFGQVLLVVGLQVAGVLSGIGNGLAGTLMALVVLLLCRSLLGTLSSQNVQNGGSRMGMGMLLMLRRIVAKA